MKLFVAILTLIIASGCSKENVKLYPEDRIMNLLKSEGHTVENVKVNVNRLSSKPHEIERIKSKYNIIDLSIEEIFTQNIHSIVDIMRCTKSEIKFMYIEESGKTSTYTISIND